MEPGTKVEVRSRFAGSWSRGFEIFERLGDNGDPRYRVRRRSDGSVLPADFGADEVREERRKRETWWI